MSGRMKILVVILVVVGVWAAGSFVFGEFVFSGMGPSQPVVKTHVPPRPVSNATASVVMDSYVNIGAAVKGLHGAPYRVVTVSSPKGTLVDYLLPDGQYSAIVQAGGVFESLIVGSSGTITYAVVTAPVATFRGTQTVTVNGTTFARSYVISVYAIPVPGPQTASSHAMVTPMSIGLPYYDITVTATVWQNWSGFEGSGGVESNAAYNVDLYTLEITGIGSGGSQTYVSGIYQQVKATTTVSGVDSTIGEVKQYGEWELNLYYEQVWCSASAWSQFNTYEWNMSTGTTFNKWISFF